MKTTSSTTSLIQMGAGVLLPLLLLPGDIGLNLTGEVVNLHSLFLGWFGYVLTGSNESSSLGVILFGILTLIEVAIGYLVLRKISNRLKKRWNYFGRTFFWSALLVFIICLAYGFPGGVMTARGFFDV